MHCCPVCLGRLIPDALFSAIFPSTWWVLTHVYPCGTVTTAKIMSISINLKSILPLCNDYFLYLPMTHSCHLRWTPSNHIIYSPFCLTSLIQHNYFEISLTFCISIICSFLLLSSILLHGYINSFAYWWMFQLAAITSKAKNIFVRVFVLCAFVLAS